MSKAKREEIRRKRRRRALIRYYSKVTFLLALGLLIIVIIGKGGVFLFGGSSDKASDKTLEETEYIEATDKKDEEKRLNLLLDEKRQEQLLDKILANEDEYPEELVNLAKSKPETRQFVYNYLTKEQEAIATIGSANKIKYYYEKGTIPLFQQWDERWGYYDYGDDFLALTGCGPTSLTMVYVGLTGDTSQNPYTVAKMSEENDYFVSGSGSSWELMNTGCENLGLVAKRISLDESRINAELDAGRPIIASMGPGDFTSSGHFIVLVNYSEEGYEIRDPDSITRSRQKWPFDRIKDQIKNLWSFEVR